jgi:hypothetical protein
MELTWSWLRTKEPQDSELMAFVHQRLRISLILMVLGWFVKIRLMGTVFMLGTCFLVVLPLLWTFQLGKLIRSRDGQIKSGAGIYSRLCLFGATLSLCLIVQGTLLASHRLLSSNYAGVVHNLINLGINLVGLMLSMKYLRQLDEYIQSHGWKKFHLFIPNLWRLRKTRLSPASFCNLRIDRLTFFAYSRGEVNHGRTRRIRLHQTRTSNGVALPIDTVHSAFESSYHRARGGALPLFSG